jgi:hypothetical protein
LKREEESPLSDFKTVVKMVLVRGMFLMENGEKWYLRVLNSVPSGGNCSVKSYKILGF